MDLLKEDGAKIKGVHVISICDARSPRAQRLEDLIEGVRIRREKLLKDVKIFGSSQENQLRVLWEEYNWYLEQLHKRFLKRQMVVENLTTTAGRSVLMQRLAGITTYTGIVNYGALGTTNTAANVADVKLGTEVYRKGLSSGTYSTNIAYLENFYTATEVTGTFEEYGFFIDGTGTVDSGQLWNRWVATNAKTNVETMNVQSTITLASA